MKSLKNHKNNIYQEYVENNRDFAKTVIDVVNKESGSSLASGGYGKDLFVKINSLIVAITKKEWNHLIRIPCNDYDGEIRKCIDAIIKLDESRRSPEKKFMPEESLYRQAVIEDNSSLLHYACEYASIIYINNVIRYLVAEKKMDPEKRDRYGKKPADYITEERFPGRSENIKGLLRSGHFSVLQLGQSSKIDSLPMIEVVGQRGRG